VSHRRIAPQRDLPPARAIPPRPRNPLLLIVALLFAQLSTIMAPAIAAIRNAQTTQEIAEVYPGLALLFGNTDLARYEVAKRKAELRLIDFVELFWPVLDGTGQPFVRTWVQEAICDHLEAVSNGRISKLLINVPPGFTKSRLVNVLWPAWEWGPRNRPDLRYMSWSYSAQLSEDQNEDCRKVIKHEIYQRFWGDRFELDETSDAKSYYKNNKGGWRRSSSVAGQTTGFRADRLLFDDPHNVKDADSEAALKEATRWFARSLPTRVRNLSADVRVKVPYWVRAVHGKGLEQDPDDNRPVTQSATIGIMQRVHLHDISGVILKNPALGYEILLIEMRYKGDLHPARKSEHWRGSSIGYQDPRSKYGELADPIRFPEDEVKKMELQLMIDGGTDAVAAQLDQWPLETSGSWFKVDWLKVVKRADVPADVPLGKRGFDFGGGGTSKKADPTAHARVARGNESGRFYLWDHATRRGSPGDVEAFIDAQHTKDPPSIDWSLPEDPGTGKLYADYIVRKIGPGRYVHTSPEAKDKITRAKPVSAQAQHDNFYIVEHEGYQDAINELVDFPYGEHDDIVDAISRAFMAVVAMPDRPAFAGGISIVGEDN
jgi:predicted phage terminase large subunit-like protein